MDLLTKKAVFPLKREVTPWFLAKVKKAEALGLGLGAGVVAECQEPPCLMQSLLGESSLGPLSQNVENFRLSQAECPSLMLSDVHKIKSLFMLHCILSSTMSLYWYRKSSHYKVVIL